MQQGPFLHVAHSDNHKVDFDKNILRFSPLMIDTSFVQCTWFFDFCINSAQKKYMKVIAFISYKAIIENYTMLLSSMV